MIAAALAPDCPFIPLSRSVQNCDSLTACSEVSTGCRERALVAPTQEWHHLVCVPAVERFRHPVGFSDELRHGACPKRLNYV